ncbi:hypothetical protein AMECASPLE_026625 [Ameca splendens]|uniref:Uncharacterized protein n=1 Tax=Ameca splendens TaxID=208324 RepID=A0ABV0YT86_9TELE
MIVLNTSAAASLLYLIAFITVIFCFLFFRYLKQTLKTFSGQHTVCSLNWSSELELPAEVFLAGSRPIRVAHIGPLHSDGS